LEALPIIRERIYSLSLGESRAAISLLGDVGELKDIDHFYVYLKLVHSIKLKKGMEAFAAYFERHKDHLSIKEVESFLGELEVLHAEEAFIAYYLEDLRHKISITKGK